MDLKTKHWFIQSTSGLLLTGAGLCLSIDAGIQKYSGLPWKAYGCLALVVFNSGLCLLIDAAVKKSSHK
jgi:hypothetical protein